MFLVLFCSCLCPINWRQVLSWVGEDGGGGGLGPPPPGVQPPYPHPNFFLPIPAPFYSRFFFFGYPHPKSRFFSTAHFSSKSPRPPSSPTVENEDVVGAMLQLHLNDQQFHCLLRCAYIRGLMVLVTECMYLYWINRYAMMFYQYILWLCTLSEMTE